MAAPKSPGLDHEEGPGSQKQNEEPEIAYEEDIPSDGVDEAGQAEIKKIPARPELSPAPDELNK